MTAQRDTACSSGRGWKQLFAAALLACLLLASCSDRDATGLPDGGDPFSSPDQLIKSLKEAWEQRSLVEYEKLLEEQFQFFFNPNDGLEQYFGLSWDRAHELNAAAAMFRGDAGYDRIMQEAIPPVLSVEFTTFTKISDWNDPGTDPLYVGTLVARYSVGIRVTLQGVAQATWVTGTNAFYVAGYPASDGTTLCKIKILEDQEYVLGTEKSLASSSAGTNWGRLKSLWAAPDTGKQQ